MEYGDGGGLMGGLGCTPPAPQWAKGQSRRWAAGVTGEPWDPLGAMLRAIPHFVFPFVLPIQSYGPKQTIDLPFLGTLSSFLIPFFRRGIHTYWLAGLLSHPSNCSSLDSAPTTRFTSEIALTEVSADVLFSNFLPTPSPWGRGRYFIFSLQTSSPSALPSSWFNGCPNPRLPEL